MSVRKQEAVKNEFDALRARIAALEARIEKISSRQILADDEHLEVNMDRLTDPNPGSGMGVVMITKRPSVLDPAAKFEKLKRPILRANR